MWAFPRVNRGSVAATPPWASTRLQAERAAFRVRKCTFAPRFLSGAGPHVLSVRTDFLCGCATRCGPRCDWYASCNPLGARRDQRRPMNDSDPSTESNRTRGERCRDSSACCEMQQRYCKSPQRRRCGNTACLNTTPSAGRLPADVSCGATAGYAAPIAFRNTAAVGTRTPVIPASIGVARFRRLAARFCGPRGVARASLGRGDACVAAQRSTVSTPSCRHSCPERSDQGSVRQRPGGCEPPSSSRRSRSSCRAYARRDHVEPANTSGRGRIRSAFSTQRPPLADGKIRE